MHKILSFLVSFLLIQSLSAQELSITFPKEGQIVSDDFYLEWNERKDADEYLVQLATNFTFNNPIEYNTSINSVDLEALNLPDRIYFWRVIAKNNLLNIDTSLISSFKIFQVLEQDSVNLWLNGEYVIKANNSKVSRWIDLSDSNVVVETLVQNNQPVWRDSVINNFPALFFDSLTNQFVLNMSQVGKNVTVASIYRTDERTYQFMTLIRGFDNWFIGPFQRFYRAFAGSFVLGITPVKVGSFVNHTGHMRNDTLFNYVNGANLGSRAVANRPGLGWRLSNRLNGYIAEVIINNGAISDSVVDLQNDYLMDKYAPPINLGLDRTVCNFPDSISLEIDYVESFSWSTGDTTAKTVIDSAGKYYVTITDMFERTSIDSIYFILDTFDYQVDIIFSDTTICKGESIELIAGANQYQYTWNTLDTTPSITVDSTLEYIVEVNNCLGNKTRDTVNLTVNNPVFDLGIDTTICHNGIIQLGADSLFSNVSYLWSTGEVGMNINADTATAYLLTVTDISGCQYTDSINVNIDSTIFGLSLGNDTTLCVGNTIQLLNPNPSITTYSWSTGSQLLQTIVDTVGTYVLNMSNGLCSVSDSINVLIKGDAPIANFGYSNFCFLDSTNFVDSSLAPVGDVISSWNWEFGNGDSSQILDPKYSYSIRGDYSVLLKVETDKGCVDTISRIVRIEPLPKANFNFQDFITCAKDRIFHQDSSLISRGSIVKYMWDFGDSSSNQNISIQQNPFHTFDTLGDYMVKLTVESDKGCLDSVNKTLSILPTPIAKYTVPANCIADSIILSNNSAFAGIDTLNYFWTIRKIGDAFVTDRRESPVIKINSSGLYDIGLRLRTGGSQVEWCESNFKDTIEFLNSPIANFEFSTICEGDSFNLIDKSISIDSVISYQYIFENNSISNLKEPRYPGINNGIYTPNLKVTTINGCTDSISKELEVFPKPGILFSILNNNSGIPFDIDINNNTTGAETYTWKFGNGDSSNFKTPIYTYTDSGTFKLTLIGNTNKGCIDSASQNVFVFSKFIDATLSKVFLSENVLGDIEVSFQVLNSGFTQINDLTIGVDLNDEFEFRESYSTKIYAGRADGFKMDATFIPDAGKKIDFVCVRVLTVNSEQDSIISNNELCELGFSNEFSINLYPNPVEDFLSLQYTLPDDGEVKLEIFDALGRMRNNGLNKKQEEGYYSLLMDFSDFERGVYFYKMTYNGNLKSGSFIVR